jgi:endonuclease YncB( thermonuclease family)
MANQVVTVTKIIDGDTFKISPDWSWGLRYGNIIRPTGYNTPERGESGYEEATLKLKNLISGQKVTLGRPLTLTYGRLLCAVYFKGRDLAEYFPEYRL